MVLAFIAAYAGGWIDAVIRVLVDSLIPIPGLTILIIIATSLTPGKGLTVDQLAVAIAVLAWPGPTRVIRSQVLVMRERGYVQMARMSGTGSLGIIFKEMMPNLAPFILASYVAAVTGSILATIGIETLGLGDIDAPTLGAMLYWIIELGALLKGAVVVAAIADHRHSSALRRPIHDLCWPRRSRKPKAPKTRLVDKTPSQPQSIH